MGRARARLLAVATVIASTLGTALALRVVPQSPDPDSNPAIPVNATGRVVFSIRNTLGSPLSITGISKPAQGSGSPDCDQMSTPIPLDPNQTFPVSLAADQQAQFVVTTTGWPTTGDRSCTFEIATSPLMVQPPYTVQVVFHVAASEDFDVQPRHMDFGSQMASNTEQQAVVVSGWGSAQTITLSIEAESLDLFTLDCSASGSGSGGKTCSLTSVGSGGSASAKVRCKGTPEGFGSASVVVRAYGGGTVVGTTTLECTGQTAGPGVTLDPELVYIYADQGSQGSASVNVGGSSTSGSLSISGGNGTFAIDGCAMGSSCPTSIPATISVHCTPGAMQSTGTLVVTASGSAQDTSTIYCIPQNTGPLLQVTPTNVSFGAHAVGGMGSASVQVTNVGGGSLTNVTWTLADATHFDVSTGCGSGSGCTLGSGESHEITVSFRPQSHGAKTTTLNVDAAEHGAPIPVTLSGTGTGGVMVVTQPSAQDSPPYHLDLGTIPLGQQTQSMIRLRNDGNALYAATITGVQPPYTLSPASDGVPETMSRDFAVTCGSNAPGAPNAQTWTITSDAYAGSPRDITVACAIANTGINVDPLAFDFGEVRTGSPARTMTVTVSNPTAVPAQIESMQLREQIDGLTLVPPSTMTTLAAGASITAELSLATGSDADLSGQFLDIHVDDAVLALPVRGKVVTARSYIAPRRLQLGTACAGTEITGFVRLVNNGTATLDVEPPRMDQSFLAATPGTTYPLDLPPGMTVIAEVTPAQSALGSLEGTMTWRDDVPSEYAIPIELEYIDVGTAVSPSALDFGIVEVGKQVDNGQRVLLENCDLAPSSITVKTLRGIRGPIAAWRLEPPVGFSKQLTAREQQSLVISFAPPGRGRYEAELVLETAGANTATVLLVGEATGRDFDSGSFYSCTCSTNGTPWRGWPIALAIVAISVRRRRGSSSAR
jgi:hypothetical protein